MKVFYDPNDNTIHLCVYCPLSGGGIAGFVEDESGDSQLFMLTADQTSVFKQYIIGEF